jgi:hypothetical protein
MALITTYQDLFPSSTIMKQYAGNGTVSVPGAGDARLVAPNGANCNYDQNNQSAPCLYENISQLRQLASPAMMLLVETKLSSLTGTTTQRFADLFFGTAPQSISGVSNYSYQLGFYKGEGKIICDYYYPGGAARLFTSGAVSDPSSNHIYRIYWNTGKIAYVPETGTVVLPDYLAFIYSVDNGTTWVALGTRARDFDLNTAFAGIVLRKWETSAVNAQADFSYFVAKQLNPADVVMAPDLSGAKETRLALEDAASTLGEGGPERFDVLGTKDAVVLPSTDVVGLEDGLVLPSVGGPKPRYDFPQINEDPSFSDVIGLEDGFFVQIDETDYIKGKYDADGKELLAGANARHVFYYDATLDPWHTHGAGHYGAGRDGKLYYDGVECGPGDFGTVAGGFRRTAWAFPDGFLDRDLIAKAAQITMPADGTLRFTVNTNGTDIASSLRWFFTGDFDVQVDYNIVSNGSGPTDGGIVIQAVMDWNNYTYARRRMFGSGNPNWDKDVRNNGSWGSYASVGGATASGKLRITRVGSTVTSYYWTGSAWAAIGSGSAMTYNRPMLIDLGFWFNSTPTGTVFEFSNFTINSGTTTNLIGWAREAAGTYRGSLAEFPQHALIACTEPNIDIIDADTNKLWASFRGAANNMVWGPASWGYVRQAVMKDGVLMVALPSSGGYGLWIDFTTDWARSAQEGGGGAFYNPELSTNMWPIWSPSGSVAVRNSGRNYQGPYANWVLQSYYVYWCDLLHDSGYQYRLFATAAGITLQRWQRWKFQGANDAHLDTPYKGVSMQTGTMRWAQFQPSTRDLLYHDRSSLYITHFAAWNAIISGGGGTWVENHTYTLSGTIDEGDRALAQDAMVVDGNYLYYARKEGVYRMDLTTGTSVLLYGIVGSGATHEILPTSRAVISVAYGVDNSVPILLVGMTYPDLSVAVNLNTNVLYWKGRLDDSHTPYSMAVGA